MSWKLAAFKRQEWYWITVWRPQASKERIGAPTELRLNVLAIEHK